ncbi:carnitine dehydratase [Acidovorax sp. Root267]|uniref:aldehyde dehydrogenase n=1 Tax=Acidovorax sp. Root267 TaxID=1736505 RepID=UPI00070E9194|nr:aldehyde dehydrogenase [Acidovorax sp. Root267]KRD26468.1 carnitine dehydratase [Acidovorax sp. Root267]
MSEQIEVARYPMQIGGKAHNPRSGEWLGSLNPATEEVWAMIPRASVEDAEVAAAAAHEALRGAWAKLTPTQRGALMFRLADLLERDAELLAQLDARDNGKPISELRKQYAYLPQHWRYFGGLVDKLEAQVIPVDRNGVFNFTRHEPVGVVLAITPWNSPLVIASWKVAPALAAGCTTIVKPSEHASISTLHFAKLVAEAGFPAGVVNVVTGYGHEVGEALVAHAKVAKVTFTGGEAGGRAVSTLAAKHLKPTVMELGGKSPVIVFDDADLDRAVPTVAVGIFSSSGQSCVAGSRLLLQAGIYDEFLRRLIDRARAIVVGDPLSAETAMGPITTRAQFEMIQSHLFDAHEQGAICAFKGERSSNFPSGGLFLPPHIFTGVTPQMRVWREEVFGPVLAVMRFETEAEAVAIANDSPFGLAAGLWTRDLDRALRLHKELQAGTVWINSYRGVSSMTPLGGFKRSGFGRENGQEAVREFLQTKSVWMEYQ